MTLSLQDRRLLRAHADFERAADAVGPVLLLVGVVRGAAALLRTAVAARRTIDPIDLSPRVLQD